VLLVDDEPTILVSLRDSLRDAGGDVVTASSGDQAVHLLRERTFDVVVSDVRLPGLSGIDLLEKVQEQDPETPVILMTAYATVDQAVDAMKKGAYDYVTKPFPNEKVVRMVQNASSLVRLKAEVRDLHERDGALAGVDFLIGTSAPWQRLLDKLAAVAPTDSTILIVGPSGTGKEMVAKAIHLLSSRKQGPLIKLHCAALPAALIENELFGHVKGAFTGATGEVKGRFELAHGGTLLLDEVDDIPLDVQVKLLRVIQERVVEPLGSGNPRPVDVRLLVTSKGSLAELVEQKRFRLDLYYRLSVVELRLPTLAERRDDIPALLKHFLTLFTRRMMRACPGFTPEAMDALLEYDYPGNVRELEHIVESACALSDGGMIGLHLLPTAIRDKARARRDLHAEFEGCRLQEAIEAFERSYLERALRGFQGSRAELADCLGISRKNLWEKLKKYGLEPPG
jgi:DNA-binding NtrC family response regulator